MNSIHGFLIQIYDQVQIPGWKLVYCWTWKVFQFFKL